MAALRLQTTISITTKNKTQRPPTTDTMTTPVIHEVVQLCCPGTAVGEMGGTVGARGDTVGVPTAVGVGKPFHDEVIL